MAKNKNKKRASDLELDELETPDYEENITRVFEAIPDDYEEETYYEEEIEYRDDEDENEDEEDDEIEEEESEEVETEAKKEEEEPSEEEEIKDEKEEEDQKGEKIEIEEEPTKVEPVKKRSILSIVLNTIAICLFLFMIFETVIAFLNFQLIQKKEEPKYFVTTKKETEPRKDGYTYTTYDMGLYKIVRRDTDEDYQIKLLPFFLEW